MFSHHSASASQCMSQNRLNDTEGFGHCMSTKHGSMAVNRKLIRSSVFRENPWSGRRESNSRSQLGKLVVQGRWIPRITWLGQDMKYGIGLRAFRGRL